MTGKLLTEGWGYHATESRRFAAELEAAATGPIEPEDLVRFVRVATHTLGEHLEDWRRAQRLAERVMSGRNPDAATGKAWAHLSIARSLAGDPAGAAEAELAWMGAAPDGPGAAAVELKFMLVAALVGSGRADAAQRLYLAAVDLARRTEAPGVAEAANRVSGALATDLLEAPSRDPAEAALMRLAAEASHEFALRGGGWYEDQVGHYLRALVANVDGDPDGALFHVEAATALLEANGGSPIDETFLHLTTAHARHLRGEAPAAAEALARSDAIAATFDKPGLVAWHAEERARVFPHLPPRRAGRA
jgi:hypothetical protein